MTTKTFTSSGPLLALLGILSLLGLAASSAPAAERDSLEIQAGPRPGYHPIPVAGPTVLVGALERPAPLGYYVNRTEQVLVQAGHYERQWVEPLYETRYRRNGRPYQVLLREGFYHECWIPARYETRTVRVWVPYREHHPAPPPACGPSAPTCPPVAPPPVCGPVTPVYAPVPYPPVPYPHSTGISVNLGWRF